MWQISCILLGFECQYVTCTMEEMWSNVKDVFNSEWHRHTNLGNVDEWQMKTSTNLTWANKTQPHLAICFFPFSQPILARQVRSGVSGHCFRVFLLFGNNNGDDFAYKIPVTGHWYTCSPFQFYIDHQVSFYWPLVQLLSHNFISSQ